MTTFCDLPTDGLLRRLRPQLLVLFGVLLGGCGGGGGGSDAPAPPAPPPPAPPPTIPPVSSTVIDIEDGHTVGAQHWPEGNTSTGGQGQPIGTHQCLASQPVTYHVHTHLSIFLNGQQLAIPEHVGFVTGSSPANDCHYPLHTHDASGLVHVHGTAPALFTLGQFFQTWGQSLTGTDLAGLTGMPVRVFVTDNGVATENTGDWTQIELSSHRHITIQVGTDITEIPQYTWIGP
jgi:hypothetical protein